METPRNDNKIAADNLKSAVSREETHTETTGTGFSEAEKTARNKPDHGSQFLVEKYNINDQAHSDSDLDNFIKTTSNFRHENEQ